MIPAAAKTSGRFVVIFWVLAAVAIPLWASLNVSGWGWDFHVYTDAIQCLREGHDPYLEGTIAQQDFYAHRDSRAHNFLARPGHPPLPYLYPPVTIPLLRAIGKLPEAGVKILGWLYWLAYVAGTLAVVRAVMQFVEPQEMPGFVLFAPVAVFFPGLLQHDAILGGNVAYLLYGLVFSAAAQSWRSNRWRWFYASVLIASCVKLPFLCLLGIPVFSARRQWRMASLTAIAAIAFVAVQRVLWPVYFHSYLQAASLNPAYLGFGLSPAGLLGEWLSKNGLSYERATTLFYLAYAIPVLASLVFWSRRFLQGRLSLTRWGPVLLVGVMLLNPRLKEYDVAPLTIPLALVAWRGFFRLKRPVLRACLYGLLFLSANLVASAGLAGTNSWNVTMCFLMIGTFVFGSFDMSQQISRP